MRLLLDVQQKLIPDLLDVMVKRDRILRYIRLHEPIGRRSLSSSLDLSERVLRNEVTYLKDQGLIEFSTAGMKLTAEGNSVLHALEPVMKDLLGLRVLEERLSKKLHVKEVIVIPGDSDEFPWVKKEIGRACVLKMKQKLGADEIVAVTGGTTVAAVAQMMTAADTHLSQATFVPARGGIGEKVENLANTICATMAQKVEGKYRLLHVPDQLSEETYVSLIQERSVKEILSLIKSASMVIHGIGEANAMAKRRGSSESVLKLLQVEKAVAEAFGYYFNQSGDIIHRERTIGLQLDDLDDGKVVISVAGGLSKAESIVAYMNYRPSDVLITDEAVAKAILE